MKIFSTTVLITLVAAIISAGISPASAQCKKRDAKFPAFSMWHTKCACQGCDGHRGDLQGHIDTGMTWNACVEVERTHVLLISVTNLYLQAGFDLNDADCTWKLSTVVDKWLHGRLIEAKVWHFRWVFNFILLVFSYLGNLFSTYLVASFSLSLYISSIYLSFVQLLLSLYWYSILLLSCRFDVNLRHC